jgi:competence protein ComEC
MLHWGLPAFSLGIGLGVALAELSSAPPVVLVAVWWSTTLAALLSRRPVLWSLALACAGVAVGSARADAVSAHWAAQVPSWEAERVVWLEVQEGPRPARRDGPYRARLLASRALDDTASWRPESIEVLVDGVAPLWLPVRGDRYVARGRFAVGREAAHRFGRNPRLVDARAGRAGRLTLTTPPAIAAAASHPLRGLDVARIRLERAILSHVEEREAGVLLALLTGTRGVLDPVDRHRFAESGAAHVLAVSGLHLGLLCAFFFGGVERVLRRLMPRAAPPSSRQLAALLTMPFIAAYVVFTGAPASACRAGWMALCLLLAAVTERRGASRSALALATGALLLWRPLWIGDLGFQLSVVATWSLVETSGRAIGPSLATRPRWSRVLGGMVESVRVSTVATIATAPPLLWTTGKIPWVSPLANLIVVPPLALGALPLGILGGTLGACELPGAGAVLQLAAWCARASLSLAELYEPVFAQNLVWGRPVGWAIVGWCALALWSPRMGIARGREYLVVGALSVAMLAAGRPLAWRDVPGLHVHAIAVRRSVVTWVQLPGPRHVLFGAGPGGFRGTPAAMREVVPYLNAHGVTRIDGLVLRSGAAREIGGAHALVDALHPRWVLAGSAAWDAASGERLLQRMEAGAVAPVDASTLHCPSSTCAAHVARWLLTAPEAGEIQDTEPLGEEGSDFEAGFR